MTRKPEPVPVYVPVLVTVVVLVPFVLLAANQGKLGTTWPWLIALTLALAGMMMWLWVVSNRAPHLLEEPGTWYGYVLRMLAGSLLVTMATGAIMNMAGKEQIGLPLLFACVLVGRLCSDALIYALGARRRKKLRASRS